MMRPLPMPPLLPPAPPLSLRMASVLLCLVLLVLASFMSLPLQWGALFTQEAWRTSAEFLRGFLPPDVSLKFLYKIAIGSAETLAMSVLATLLALLCAVLLALPASGRWGGREGGTASGTGLVRALTRTLLNVLRAIPELVWASVLLIAAGLGPFAGTLALAAHTAGVLGRLFADAFENAPPAAEQTLRINGAGSIAVWLYATLPQALPQMLSYTLYRWENNIRAATILGVVGAGGLGQVLKYHLSLFHMRQAASVIIAMLLMVALVDALSFMLRRGLSR